MLLIKNQYVKDWEVSVKKLDYRYKILGLGQKWEGFQTLFNLILKELYTRNSDEIIAITDAYDLVFVEKPKILMDRYLELARNGEVVIGIEDHCMINCDSGFINKCKTKPGKYINTGLIMGPVRTLIEGYEYCVKYGKDDDQIGWARFYAHNCDKVVLDYKSSLVLNYYISSFLMPHLWGKKLSELEWVPSKGFYNKTEKNYPCIIHMPYHAADMGKRSEFIRSSLFKNRKPISNSEYFSEWTKHVKKTMSYPAYQEFSGIIFLIIFLIILFLYILIRR